MIEAMGFARSEVYIANVVKCRPPGNRDPEPDEIEACEPFLKAQIAAIRPAVIVALGRFAVQTLLRDATPISRLRGRWREYEGVKLMPTFHPAYLLRNPAEKKPAWEDLQLVMKEFGKVAARGGERDAARPARVRAARARRGRWPRRRCRSPAPAGAAEPARPRVLLLDVKAPITTGTAEYVEAGLARAKLEGFEAVAIALDTPGGHLEATRDIVQRDARERRARPGLGGAGRGAGRVGRGLHHAGGRRGRHAPHLQHRRRPPGPGRGRGRREAGRQGHGPEDRERHRRLRPQHRHDPGPQRRLGREGGAGERLGHRRRGAEAPGRRRRRPRPGRPRWPSPTGGSLRALRGRPGHPRPRRAAGAGAR